MSNTFFVSDHHFGHSNILTFKDNEGNLIRPGFDSIEEHDEFIIQQHNKIVGDTDRVYLMGDLVINKKFLHLTERLKGRKVLLMGNHDIFGAKEYLKYVEDVRAYKVFSKHGIICSHIPLSDNIFPRWKLNVHGHLHSFLVTTDTRLRVVSENSISFEIVKDADPRYLNVSLEQLPEYYPKSLDEVLQHLSTIG